MKGFSVSSPITIFEIGLHVYNGTPVYFGGAVYEQNLKTLVTASSLKYISLGCVAGQYSPNIYIQGCAFCPRGHYAAQSGMTACTPCPNNLMTPSTGAQSLDACSVCQDGVCHHGVCVVSGESFRYIWEFFFYLFFWFVLYVCFGFICFICLFVCLSSPPIVNTCNLCARSFL